MKKHTIDGNPLGNIRADLSEDRDPDKTNYSFWSESQGNWVALEPTLRHQPKGLKSAAIQAGIKYPDVYDLTIVKMPTRGPAAGVFTKNRCASPSVQIDREHLQDGFAQALVVVSKNANIFTSTATEDTQYVVDEVAKIIGVNSKDVLISCTGVIGVALPVAKVLKGISQFPSKSREGLSDEVSKAILTTDRGPKVCSVQVGEVVLAGMAKGAGMIEPNMATMLVYFFTNLAIDGGRLRKMLTEVCDRTFNSISVDSDTSTSDSVIIFSTGEIPATPEREADLRNALTCAAAKLSRDIVYQAEGATKLIEATVREAHSDSHARQVARLIVNSPLIKTAIFGADPNWGRVVMAIGKPGQDRSDLLDPRQVSIAVNGYTLFKGTAPINLPLAEVSASIRERKTTEIVVSLGEGQGEWIGWGCDLGYDYVKTNAEYTT